MAVNEQKIKILLDRFDELTASMADPAVASDVARYSKMSRELGELSSKVEVINRYKAACEEEKEALEILLLVLILMVMDCRKFMLVIQIW